MKYVKTLLALVALAVAGWLVWDVCGGREMVPLTAAVLYGTGVGVFLFSFVFDVYLGCLGWAWPLAGVVMLGKVLEPGQNPWIYLPAFVLLPIVAGVLLMSARSDG